MGAELTGFLEGLGTAEVIFVPALPKSGRTTVKGIHYVNGVPLAETVFARDPLNPVRESEVIKILAAQSPCAVVLCEKGEDPGQDLPPHESGTILVCDGETDADLAEIGKCLGERGKLRHTAGCAGFAEVLSEWIPPSTEKEKALVLEDRRFLFLCGSVNQISVDQANYAEDHGFSSYTLKSREILDPDFPETPEFNALAKKITAEVGEKGKMLVRTLRNYGELAKTETYAREKGIQSKQLGLRIADRVGLLVKEILKSSKIKNLVVFGGDTLIGIIEKLGCDGIFPLEEIAPGVVIAKTIGRDPALSPVIVTKAGGFGDVDVIDGITRYLTVPPSSPSAKSEP